MEYTLPIVSRLLFANEDRGLFMSVMCSLITDSVSLITGESALKVPARIGILEDAVDARSAVCDNGERWPLDALVGLCWFTDDAE